MLSSLTLFIAAALGVVGLFVFLLRGKDWKARADVASTVSGIAVTIGVAVAGFEYLLHIEDKENKKIEAIGDIMRLTVDSKLQSQAAAILYDTPVDELLAMSAQQFDRKVATMTNLFWVVGNCVLSKKCDEQQARDAFCFDFRTYECAYKATHRAEQRFQEFSGPEVQFFHSCPDRHRFNAPPEMASPKIDGRQLWEPKLSQELCPLSPKLSTTSTD